jgi:YidC/Oxa1 family membrane protein insertase
MLLPANIFQPLIDVFEAVLKFFHNSVGVGWGLSILLLTVLIRALLVPLTVKQFSSMQKLQQLQPQLKAIQTRYKDDKQRQQQEMMKFYRENQVNPLASCLPLVAQLPVFISLFYMLRSSLRHDICPSINPVAHAAVTHPCGAHGGASFLFIPDLTDKATGAVLIVLIVLYVGTQLISSRMMANPQMDQTQQRLIMLMPLFFVVFIINFPAGVILYWVTTNTWTMGQQYVIRRRLGMNQPPPAVATNGAAGPAVAVSGEDGNGTPRASGLAGGISGLLRGRRPEPEEAGAAAGTATRSTRAAAPPPPPRKKKKRSGRRR